MSGAGQRFALARCAAAQAGVYALGAAVRGLRFGLADTRAQIPVHAAAWAEANAAALRADGPLLVALGDSAAQGIGAASHELSWVGQLAGIMRQRDGRAWRVVNLSRSGARIAHVLDEQLPALDELAGDLVVCAVGTNNLLRMRLADLTTAVGALIAALPAGAVLATMPQGIARRRAVAVNELIVRTAPAAGLVVADVWAHTGPPWQGNYAGDFFHPSARGYAGWARAFALAIADADTP